MAKIRAIVNGVSFYTNTTVIKDQRVGDNSLVNTALYCMLDRMGKNTGIASTIVLYDGKMKRHSFDVQLSVV